jgi:hypothetical protein
VRIQNKIRLIARCSGARDSILKKKENKRDSILAICPRARGQLITQTNNSGSIWSHDFHRLFFSIFPFLGSIDCSSLAPKRRKRIAIAIAVHTTQSLAPFIQPTPATKPPDERRANTLLH